MPPDSPLSHAALELRRLDRDRFLSALFAPASQRERLMVLYAFNAEIARVREAVREPLAGMVRLQWWREVVENPDRPVSHPVAAPLARLIAEAALPPEPFERLLAAREHDLDEDGPQTLAAVETYAVQTGGSLAELALHCLGGGDARELAAARHAGTAFALAGLARAQPFLLSIGRMTLPEEALKAAGSSADAVLAGQAPKAAIIAAVRQMAMLAETHAGQARCRIGRARIAALLPATIAAGYCRDLARAGYDPFDGRVALARPRPVRLALRALWGGV